MRWTKHKCRESKEGKCNTKQHGWGVANLLLMLLCAGFYSSTASYLQSILIVLSTNKRGPSWEWARNNKGERRAVNGDATQHVHTVLWHWSDREGHLDSGICKPSMYPVTTPPHSVRSKNGRAASKRSRQPAVVCTAIACPKDASTVTIDEIRDNGPTKTRKWYRCEKQATSRKEKWSRRGWSTTVVVYQTCPNLFDAALRGC